MTSDRPSLSVSAAPAIVSATGQEGNAPLWRFVFLAQIADFAEQRRTLGRPRAALLVEQVAARAREVLPRSAAAIAIDCRTIEVAFEAVGRERGDEAVAALTAGFERPFPVDGESRLLDLAIGAAAGLATTVDELHLLEEAELSLAEYRAHCRVQVRDASQGHDPLGRVAMVKALPSAIRDDQFLLHYQPKVHLRSQEVASIEALIRWNHPQLGLVMPGGFIPLAEESRLIDALTLWVIRRVIRDQRFLRTRGYDLTVFINVSGQLLGDARFVEAANELVRDSGANIGFEVTETSVIRDPQSAIANLQRFADAGIAIAIDDYGAGLSSLAYLKQLPASELKIDKLFVTQLASSNRDPLIVRSTIDLAHALEMKVVAEGVESPAALALLTVMGCDMAQGFLISHPIRLEALVGFLDEGRHRHVAAPGDFPFRRLAFASRS